MNWITIKLMQYHLRKVKTKQTNCEHSIVKSAYGVLIKNYEDTILFLNRNKQN
jgi:hypothetical protein